MARLEEIRDRVHSAVINRIDFTREIGDTEVLDLIDEELIRSRAENDLDIASMKALRQDLFHSTRRLDVLQDLIDRDEITDIMINGPERIFIEKGGGLTPYQGTFSSKEKLEDVIQQIVSACNRVVNESVPIVDARLPGGARVHVVLPPIALNGPIMTIRRFPDRPIGMEDLLRFGSLSPEIAAFLSRLVRAGYNIFVSGGTGSGKTTFLNAMSAFIPGDERIITIEDNAELQILHIANLVRLEARNANVEGENEISIRDLIRASLRMRPDRIIVGEVRGGEAIDMIQAMNTGHDGSMSTGHANSAEDMLSRLETMVLMGMDLPVPAIRGQIAAAIDIIVHLGRLRDKSRKLLEICEITGIENGQIILSRLYAFRETGEENGKIIGTWDKKNPRENTTKLAMAGMEPV